MKRPVGHPRRRLVDRDDALLGVLFEAALDCVIIMDEGGVVREFNPAAEKTFCWPRDAVVGRILGEVIVPPHLRAAHQAGLARLLEGGQSRMLGRRLETEAMRADGAIFPIELAISETRVGGKRLFVAYLREITERRQAEERLRRSEQNFRAIVEDQTELILRFGPDRKVTFVNRALAVQLGQPAAALLGTSVLDHVAEHNRGWFAAQLDALTPEVPTVSYETENVLPDGNRAWEHWSDRALFDGVGQLIGYQSVGRDITAAKRIETELRQSEQQFRDVVQDQTELICRFDAEFRLTFSNVAHAQIFGCSPADLIGRHLFDDVPEAARDQLRAALIARTPDDPVVRFENEKHRPDGLVGWYDWTNRALFDAEGRIRGYQCVGRDITERRAQQAEILRQREALHQQEKLTALGSLLAGVAHELNNPLAVVVGRALMLEEELADPVQAAAAAKLRAAAERCSRIVKTFLAMARQRPHERRPVAVQGMLDAVLGIAAYGLRSTGITIVRPMAAGDSGIKVLADEDQLHQLFLNLVINAQHALRDVPPPRLLSIESRVVRGWVEIEVADNGPGVPIPIRKRIFEPFFTTKPVGVGTGVGLSVSHAIVEAHGGTIEVLDRPGGGALFRVRLPRAVDHQTALPIETIPAAFGSSAARILVVDDEREVLAMIAEILRRDGYCVEVAFGGREAMQRLEEGPFDLVVSDLAMPDGDGRELYRKLRAGYPALAKRLIVLTGDILGTVPADLPELDREQLLEKPIAPAALREAVRRRLPARNRPQSD